MKGEEYSFELEFIKNWHLSRLNLVKNEEN